MSGFSFPVVRQPAVSVVMVTLDAGDALPRALRALLGNTEPCYELIVIDNGSGDATPSVLEQLENATVVFNDRNVGFAAASNQGAAHARGRYIVFLNQDAFVEPGWLPPLLERIESDERIGAVGPMMLNPDGSVQCAGALLSRSGSVECYGEGDSPDRPEYRFARVVDFLAGACLLVRRKSFNEIGGFDAAYGLGYYEDADLCLSLAARGYLSVYEPSSSVTHVRGRPGPTLLQLARRNRALFERRWRPVLASRPLAPLASRPRRTLVARDAPAATAGLDDVPVRL